MVDRGERMKTRQPQDGIAQPGVNPGDGSTHVVLGPKERWNLHPREQRQGMAF